MPDTVNETLAEKIAEEILEGLRRSVLDLDVLTEFEEASEDAEAIIARHLAERDAKVRGALVSCVARLESIMAVCESRYGGMIDAACRAGRRALALLEGGDE